MARARVKMRSYLYGLVEENQRVSLLSMLAAFALFDDDAAALNRLESELMKVTPELIQFTAREYLRPTNRTISKLNVVK